MTRHILLASTLLLATMLISSCGNDNGLPGGSGLIEATEVVVSAETMGQLQSVNFKEGDRVVSGDTLCMIDTMTVSLQLAQAHAAREAAVTQQRNAEIAIKQAALNLNLAEKEFDRAKSLIKTGSINQQQYDNLETVHARAELAEKSAKATFEAAAAELSRIDANIGLLEKQHRDCFPIAPVSGVITDKYIETGELATLGKPLVKISQIDTVTVKVYLPPADLTKIKLGNRAEIDPEDGRELPLEGTVTWISSEAEFTPKNVQTREARANLVYAVKITIPNPDEALKIGMPVSVSIP